MGLGDRGTVRLVEPPHTERNYILDEMGFRIARDTVRSYGAWHSSRGSLCRSSPSSSPCSCHRRWQR
ncbi:MAG: hypothetical protein R3D25_15495 [Geminicoccaceae bacterium]